MDLPTPRLQGADASRIAEFLETAGVPPRGRILDVPCGIGRRALALADLGFHVTAVDPNEVGLEAARSRVPAALRDRLRFHHASKDALPGLSVGETFHGILSLDHPIGRGGPDEDVAFLRRLAGHAAPDGLLVLELLHRDFFAARTKSFAFHVLGDMEQHEFRTFDPVTGLLELTWKFYRREGESLRHRGGAEAKMRLLTPHEAASALHGAGWRVTASFGGWGREAIHADRRKFLVVARLDEPERGTDPATE